MRSLSTRHLLLPAVALMGIVVGLAAAILLTPGQAEQATAAYYDSLPAVEYISPSGDINGEDGAVRVPIPVGSEVVMPVSVDLNDTQALWYRALQVGAAVQSSVGCREANWPEVSVFWRGKDMIVHDGMESNVPCGHLYAAGLLETVQQVNEVAQPRMEEISFRRGLMSPATEPEDSFVTVQTDDLHFEAAERAPQLAADPPYAYLAFAAGMGEKHLLFLSYRPVDVDIAGCEPAKVADRLLRKMIQMPLSHNATGPGWPVPPETELVEVGVNIDSGVISAKFSRAWWDKDDVWTEAAVDCLLLTLGQIPGLTHLRLESASEGWLQKPRRSDELPLLRAKDPRLPGNDKSEVVLNHISREIMSLFVDDTKINMSAVGDVMLDRGVRRMIEKEGEDYPFAEVSHLFGEDDLTFINLECPISRSGQPIAGKMIWFRGEPENVPAMRRAGVDVINLANNHILDYGRPALVETVQHLREWGYLPLGVGMDKKEAHLPLFWEGLDSRIAFLGYTDFADIFWDWGEKETFAAGTELPGVAALDPRLMIRDVRQAAGEADAVVVSVHWGEEYVPHPSEEHVNLAHHLVQQGADAIIGHHPHVLQSIDVYEEKPIFYSLGNFIFDQEPLPRRQTVVAQIDWSRHQDQLMADSATLIPYLIREGQPTRAEGDDAEAIIERLKRLCGERGTELMREGLRLLLPLADR